jgi:microcystin-dependent protein
MSEPFIGQIIAVGFNFAPVGWALCNGQTLDISSNAALYALIGTTYGGNGVNNFNLPNLTGRVAINQGQGPGLSNYVLGQAAGNETVTLSSGQMPGHTHVVLGTSAAATSANPSNSSLLGSTASGVEVYAAPGNPVALAPTSIGPFPGGSQPHENRQPFQVINYIIALVGIYPSQG